jgi:aspartokinase
VRDEGNELVVVVSARSGVTNELIARAKAMCPNPSEREMDMLLAIGEQETIALTAMALHGVGVDAVSYTGAQAGIFTDKVHTKAKIKTINAKPIEADLKAGKVVIVAGFPGHQRGRPHHHARPRRLRPDRHRARRGGEGRQVRNLHRRRRCLHRRSRAS